MNDLAREPELMTRSDLTDRQSERLRHLLEAVVGPNEFWTGKYERAGVDLHQIRTLGDLPKLPFASKQELVKDQFARPPYGTNVTFELTAYSRLHQTSGTTGSPMRWLDTPASWQWFLDCWAQIFRIVGLRPDDRLFFPFSFGPFVGFWAAFEGANQLGNLCIAGGGMSSSARLRMIDENQATVVCCTPTYALRLAEVAREEGVGLAAGSVRALVVAGEPGGGIPATRQRIESAWGARLFDHWGMTELGAMAVECVENPGGLHVLEGECIAEIVDPESGEPVELGNEGELVVTNLGRVGSPLIRYRTGDLVRADVDACPCGRELLRLAGGILGRADDMLTIRGNNVYPTSLEAILRQFDDVAEYRIEVASRREMQHMTIQIEPTPDANAEQLVARVGSAIKDRLNFQAEVVSVPPGTLPRFELKGRRFFRTHRGVKK